MNEGDEAPGTSSPMQDRFDQLFNEIGAFIDELNGHVSPRASASPQSQRDSSVHIPASARSSSLNDDAGSMEVPFRLDQNSTITERLEDAANRLDELRAQGSDYAPVELRLIDLETIAQQVDSATQSLRASQEERRSDATFPFVLDIAPEELDRLRRASARISTVVSEVKQQAQTSFFGNIAAVVKKAFTPSSLETKFTAAGASIKNPEGSFTGFVVGTDAGHVFLQVGDKREIESGVEIIKIDRNKDIGFERSRKDDEFRVRVMDSEMGPLVIVGENQRLRQGYEDDLKEDFVMKEGAEEFRGKAFGMVGNTVYLRETYAGNVPPTLEKPVLIKIDTYKHPASDLDIYVTQGSIPKNIDFKGQIQGNTSIVQQYDSSRATPRPLPAASRGSGLAAHRSPTAPAIQPLENLPFENERFYGKVFSYKLSSILVGKVGANANRQWEIQCNASTIDAIKTAQNLVTLTRTSLGIAVEAGHTRAVGNDSPRSPHR
ncbi:MAG: hypothetical protein V4568_00075 [Pseudomonadota bacterium]